MVVVREVEVVVNPVDRVTPALNRIAQIIERLNGGMINIKLDNKIFDSMGDLQENINDLGQTVTVNAELVDNASGPMKDISVGAEKSSKSVDKISESGKKIGDSLDNSKKKGLGFFDSLEQGSNKVSSSLMDLKEKFAAIAITGAIGGISWLGAKESSEYQAEILSKIGERVSPEEQKRMEKFIGEAKGSGYTTSSKRTELVNYVETRTKLRGDKAEAAVSGVEKKYFESPEAKKDFSSAQELMRAASLKSIRGLDMQAQLDSIFGQGFSKKSVNTRFRIMAEVGGKVDINKAMEEMPEDVLKNRLSEISKSIGSTMIGPMNTLLDGAIKVADALSSIPGFSQGAGIFLMATTAGIGFKLLLDATSMAKSGLFGMLGAIGLTKTAEGELVIVQRARTAATLVSNAATRLATLGTVMFATTEGAAAASTGGLAAAEGVLTASTLTLGTALSILAVPLLILGAILAIVAYKTGVFQKIWQTLSHTQIAKDFGAGIKEAGEWISGLIRSADRLYKAFSRGEMGQGIGQGFKSSVATIDAVYKRLKETGLLDLMGKGMAISLGALGMPTSIVRMISGIDLVGAENQTIIDVLKKIQSLWDSFVGWLKGGWRAIVSLPANIADAMRQSLPSWAGGYSDEQKEARKKGIKPGERGWPGDENQPPGTPGSEAQGWGDWLAGKLKANPDLAQREGENLTEWNERTKAQRLALARELFPSSSYSDEALQPIINDISDYLLASEGGKPHQLAKLNQRKINEGISNNAPALPASTSEPGDPFSSPSMTNKIKDSPIEIKTKPAEDIHGGADVQSSFQAVGSWLYDGLSNAWYQYQSSATGSDVAKSGLARVHENEPIVPARLNKPGKLNAALDRLNSGNYSGGARSTQISVGGLKVEVINPVVLDAAAAYQLSDILKRELDPYIEEVVKRKIGQFST